jgi:hypothetical protein
VSVILCRLKDNGRQLPHGMCSLTQPSVVHTADDAGCRKHEFYGSPVHVPQSGGEALGFQRSCQGKLCNSAGQPPVMGSAPIHRNRIQKKNIYILFVCFSSVSARRKSSQCHQLPAVMSTRRNGIVPEALGHDLSLLCSWRKGNCRNEDKVQSD